MFKVTLTNGKEDLDLFFKLRTTDISKKWYAELKKDYSLYETNRFSNWNNDGLIDELNYHIDLINNYDFVIDKKISTDSAQRDLNYLHKFFEDLRGEITQKTAWFLKAPDNVKCSVEKFNILIHQLESNIRTKNKHPTLVVTFNHTKRIELDREDFNKFTFKWTSGTVYINYCHVGKTVLDIFKDQDNLAEAVRPQTHYSADFMIKFGPSVNILIYWLRYLILKLWLVKKNFKFKHISLGMIPVADLETNVSYEVLTKFNKVKKVTCLTQ
jgi:virulence-associated protein VapD